MCGIVGIYSENHVASSIYDSLLMLQHRGQDAAGMVNSFDFKRTVSRLKEMRSGEYIKDNLKLVFKR